MFVTTAIIPASFAMGSRYTREGVEAILDLETRWAILDDKKGKFKGAVDLKRELEAATSDYLKHHADFAK